MRLLRIICSCLLFIAISLDASVVSAQNTPRNKTFEEYIRKFYIGALRQQDKYSIPASITLAQGLLETGGGTSTLASVHNNHFGIKCHNSWRGKTTRRNDDAPNECFRSYERWEDSFEDRSRFLQQARYARLFALRHDDYRGWARGLQTAGYATNKGYANKLIQLVELYELYTFDEQSFPSWWGRSSSVSRGVPKDPKERGKTKKEFDRPMRQAYLSYGLLYVLADPGDSFEKISRDMGIDADDLASYNEAPLNFPLSEGDVVYLEPKRTRAVDAYPTYTVRVGDSMHSIAQKFGLKLDKLYKYNKLDEEYIPEEGDVLRLR